MSSFIARSAAASVAVIAAFSLAACATRQGLEAPYDDLGFEQAILEPEAKKPVEVVEMPKVLPLPGQLKPLPGKKRLDEHLPPQEAVLKANQAARMEPTRAGYINRHPGLSVDRGRALPPLCQSGKGLDHRAAGRRRADRCFDRRHRALGSRRHPERAGAARLHILIKPTLPDLQTNLVVLTDRRTYHVELISTKGTYMASVSWTYPADSLIALRKQNVAAIEDEQRIADRGVRLDSLNFRYRIEGDQPPWRPLRAFDDGRKVYIQMPSGLRQGEAPPLFVAGAGGRPTLGRVDGLRKA